MTSNKHIIAVPVQMWGHTRALCTLVPRMVKLRSVNVTLFTSAGTYDRVKAEVSRDIAPGEEHVLSRIRIIALEGQGHNPMDLSALVSSFQKAWTKIINDEPLTCLKTGTQYEPIWGQPCAAIIDLFAIGAFEHAREHNPHGIKLISWYASSMLSFFTIFERDLLPTAEAEAARTGKPFDVVASELLMQAKGELVKIPCLPTVYDYELRPQELTMPPEFAGRVLIRVPSVLKRTDAVVTFDAADFYPENTVTVKKWFAETSRKVCYAGPLIPSGEQAAAAEQRGSQNGDSIIGFLDRHAASHGEKSVIYITFGSVFWPKDPAKVWAVLDVIMEKKIPFVMSHASPMPWAVIPEDMKNKIAAYGDAIVSSWVPQQQVLDHPAVGWCISHGGQNGTLETIMAGIPLILWPIAAEQPMNAIHLTDHLDVAYELVEVRNGSGLGPIYRNGKNPTGTIDAVKAEMRDVLDRAFGKDGGKKRDSMRALQKTLRAAWSDNGIARTEVEALLDEL
ncbi:UDP-Glycosyltransferase/glycogen phosphorylase [Ganoderma leucocontextum]|nr:UDP-Glycosyltransferase/glycogen phosphorylase [Ganoderma leucocontextum]